MSTGVPLPGARPPAAAPDDRGLRRALGSFATGITVITATGSAGERLGFTANSFNSVSLDPPLVLFSLARRASSLGGFLAAARFGVNVLGAGAEPLARRFAGPPAERWADLPDLRTARGTPLVAGAIAWLDCERHATHDGGDHLIFVGRVVDLSVEEGADVLPLLYFRSRYLTPGSPPG